MYGLAVAAQSGLFAGALEPEAREYAFVVWGIAIVLIVCGGAIIILNIIKKRRIKR
jgi:cytochrome c-type biogenesis protein CcmH/NrfF